MLALILPFTRELGAVILTHLGGQVAGVKDFSAEVLALHLSISYHSLFLSVCIANAATNLTIGFLLAIDFLINLAFTLRAWSLKKSATASDLNKLCEVLQLLVLSEVLEVVVPIGYLLCFLAAYYGPNSAYLGNIGSSKWQYTRVDDVVGSAWSLILLVSVDAATLLLSGLILFRVSGINLYHVLLHLQHHHWLVFALQQAFLLEYL